MSEYLAPAELTFEQAAQGLRESLELREGPVEELDLTFYDTFDGLLREAGLSVLHERDRLVLIERDAGMERCAMPGPKPVRTLLAIELGPGRWREALVAVVGARALLSLVEVHSRVLALGVLDGEHKTVVRIVLQQPCVVGAPAVGHSAGLGLRLRLTAVRGYDQELEQVRDTLEHTLGFVAAERPLVDDALTALGRAPEGISSKVQLPLRREQRADEAAAVVLLALLGVIEANLEGALADLDSEFLHDFRVSVRRSRTVQRELRAVFPPPELARFRSEFRWLQQVTGQARDFDVYVHEWDEYRAMVPVAMRRDLDPVLGVLRNRRLVARREMVRALRSQRALALRADWAAFLAGLTAFPLQNGPAAARPIGELAAERIRKVYKRMTRMGDAIDARSPPEAYHELRKKGKELRYLLELFAVPLYPDELIKPMIKDCKALQGVLGRHQDREVQIGTLGSLREEVSVLPGGPAALMAMGVLVARLGEDEQAARDEFARRFAKFASSARRKQVKEAFA